MLAANYSDQEQENFGNSGRGLQSISTESVEGLGRQVGHEVGRRQGSMDRSRNVRKMQLDYVWHNTQMQVGICATVYAFDCGHLIIVATTKLVHRDKYRSFS